MKALPEHAMTLEEFAGTHELPERWLSLRRECELLTSNPNFWYRPDIQNTGRILAVEASDILHAQLADRDLIRFSMQRQIEKNIA